MAYVNNGTERSLKVAVNKIVGGNQVQGYPKTYDGQVSWGNLSYPTLTDEQFRQLSEGDFTARYNAFVAYVEAVENGVDFDTDITGDGAIRAGASCISTTTTTAALESYSFAVKYGTYPVDACNGAVGLAFATTPVPGVGTVLYKDAGLTQRWDLGAAVLFVSPALYGNEVAGVAVVDTDVYDVGEIMLLTGYICETQTTTLPVTTVPPVTTAAPTGYINWNLNDVSGTRLVIKNSSNTILVNEISSDSNNKTGTISNASGTYSITIYHLGGSGNIDNTVRVRVCDASGNTAHYAAVTYEEQIDIFTTLSIPTGSAFYTVYATSGDIEPATCG